MPKLPRTADKIWSGRTYTTKFLWLALAPFSLVYTIIIRLRNFLYSAQLLPIFDPGIAVISVGNLTVGGTGKTPFVLWLAREMQKRRHRVGILLRGYKGHQKGIIVVGKNGRPLMTAYEAGDEAVMLARNFVGPVIAGKDRVRAARTAQDTFELDLLILDDGFQYRRLARTVDLLLIDMTKSAFNRWPLPAGPYREPWSSRVRADAIVLTKTSAPDREPKHSSPTPSVAQGQTCPKKMFSTRPAASCLVHSTRGQWQITSLNELTHRKVLLVSGIADTSLFYAFVEQAEADIMEVMEFPDHHAYSQKDWQAINAASHGYELVVTTEKDLVKLERFPFEANKLVALRMELQVDDADLLLDYLENKLLGI